MSTKHTAWCGMTLPDDKEKCAYQTIYINLLCTDSKDCFPMYFCLEFSSSFELWGTAHCTGTKNSGDDSWASTTTHEGSQADCPSSDGILSKQFTLGEFYYSQAKPHCRLLMYMTVCTHTHVCWAWKYCCSNTLVITELTQHYCEPMREVVRQHCIWQLAGSH